MFGQEAAQGKIVTEIQGVVGMESARAIQAMIEKARAPAAGLFATVLSLMTLWIGATGVVSELKDTLNTVWHVQPALDSGLLSPLKARFMSLAFVLGIGFLLLVSLVVSAVLSALSGFFSHLFPSPWLIHIWQMVNLVLSLGVITVLFAMLYRFLPDTEVPWHERFTPTATGHVPPGDGPPLPALAGSDEHGSCHVSSTIDTSTMRTQKGKMRP